MKGNTHGHQPHTTIQSNDRDRKQKKQGHKEPKKPETWHHCETLSPIPVLAGKYWHYCFLDKSDSTMPIWSRVSPETSHV
jgi:hypothetical protein